MTWAVIIPSPRAEAQLCCWWCGLAPHSHPYQQGIEEAWPLSPLVTHSKFSWAEVRIGEAL